MSALGSQPIGDWLRLAKYSSGLREYQMTLHYDLAGAIKAEQTELAWFVRRELLRAALRLFLEDAGLDLGQGLDDLDTDIQAIVWLESFSPALAQRVWTMMNEECHAYSLEMIYTRIIETVAFIETEFNQSGSRLAAIEAWAENIDAMRSVASSIGLARSDEWYLTMNDRENQGWLAELRELLDSERRAEID